MPDSDIRDRLREDHDSVLAALDALRNESDAGRSLSLLGSVRRAWVIHALAEETVVYHALEGVESIAGSRADERFIEHELVEGLFDKLSRSRPGSLEWHARINVARELIERHIDSERNDIFVRLGERFDGAGLRELGERFRTAREKLTLLEEAKAA